MTTIAPYPLPDAILDSDIAILGRKGGGKTFTAKGLVERLLDMRRRVLVLDPLGVWAGLRTSADGEGAGYPVAIFGGAHADLPLEPAAAGAMADVLARENVPAVIDLSDLSKHAQQTFLLAFLHELRRVNTEALTIVLEEADVFAPQNPLGDDSKALHGEIDWIARRGRFKGFRLITITQRPARLSKDILTQAATLVAHRLPAPQDRDAIKAWVEGNGDRDASREVFDTLARLPVGEAWVWAPEHEILKRIAFPSIKTLDTSATPKAGEKRIEPKTLADVDLSAIKTALAVKPAAKNAKSDGKYAEPMKPDPQALAEAEQRGYEAGIRAAAEHVRHYSLLFDPRNRPEPTTIETADKHPVGQLFADDILTLLGHAAPPRQIENPSTRFPKMPRQANQLPKPAAVERAAGDLTGPQRKVLGALALWRSLGFNAPSREQVAAIAGYSATSGGFANLLGQLRTAGLIDYPEAGKIAAAGRSVIKAAADSRRVIEIVCDHLSRPQQYIVRALARQARPMTREALGAVTEYSATSGGFANLLGSLRTLGIIAYPSKGVVALEDWVRR